MIGTIRKHSSWLWGIIITVTVISFVFWGAFASRVGGGGGGGTVDCGTIYGVKVTEKQLRDEKRSVLVSYVFQTGKMPDATTMSADELTQQALADLLIAAKAEKLGIHISDDDLAAAASQRLQMFGKNGQAVDLNAVVDQLLKPNGFNAGDFETFVRNGLIVQELEQTLGLPGRLLTPQEAASTYEHQNEQLSAQVVFFSKSNYLSYVKATPEIVGQFYTNFQAEYRVPDRIQAGYVAFNASNYLAQSKAEWAKTNLSEFVESYLHKLGENYKGATNADQARTNITLELIETRAAGDARKDAMDFASALFAMEPAKPENLATLAKQKKLTFRETAPFATNSAPAEIPDSENFADAALRLSADTPYGGPVQCGTTFYVISLGKSFPSVLPSLAEIYNQVRADFEIRSAMRMSQQAGTAFDQTLTNEMATGHTFSSICAANGHYVQKLPPFSIGTADMPELAPHAALGQIKQVAYSTPVGKASPFVPTQDGGFILYLASKSPPDKAKMAAELPQFTATLRRTRANEAFNEWVNSEARTALVMPKTGQ